ncbi:putative ribonuclease H-like domain-containing protein [Tanacetum coccineum]|uniref:Ribonuclease H-like domain-containing protein n=1 Tax=Tanacetum coccineum TaxID=301880 RepID=A0ABQ5FFI3_9ASTR
MEKKDTLSSCSDSEIQQMQLIQDKSKESCMVSFQRLHSHLKCLLNNDLKGSRTENGFKRAFATLFGQDLETFTGTMFLYMDQLQKQLDNEEFQEIGSMSAFKIQAADHWEWMHYVDDADIRPINMKEPMAKERHSPLAQQRYSLKYRYIVLSYRGRTQSLVAKKKDISENRASRNFDLMITPRSSMFKRRLITADQASVFIGMMSDHNSSDLAPQRQEMSVENVSSGLVPQGQKASDYDNSDPVPPRQNVVPSAEKTDSSQQGLEFLFSPLLEEYYNPTHGLAEENNNDQAPNASDSYITTRVGITIPPSYSNAEDNRKKSWGSNIGDSGNTRDGGKIVGRAIGSCSDGIGNAVAQRNFLDGKWLCGWCGVAQFYKMVIRGALLDEQEFRSGWYGAQGPRKVTQALQDPTWIEVYVDDIIFGSTKKSLCIKIEGLMNKKFQMSSMGELTFFLGLQVMQRDDGIFISQDKSMIRSLMYLTASRPYIMFVVCACARFQVTPKTSHLHAVKRIFRYLKDQPKLGLWYPKDSSFGLESFSDSDYVRVSLDRKSTTGGVMDPKSNA